jgi:hypothetical protein
MYLAASIRWEFHLSKPLVLVAIVLGIVFLVLCGYYWLTPAGSLPSFFPGYEAGGADHHHKHAIVALVVALVLFAFAWFQSKPARA